MHRISVTIIFNLIFASLWLACPADALTNSPRTVAKQFYHWSIRKAGSGLPTVQELATVRTILHPNLVQSLSQAIKLEKCLILSTPLHQKPPLIEGNIFVGNMEGATLVKDLQAYQKDNGTFVNAQLFYFDKRIMGNNKNLTISWNDQLNFTKKSGRWLITDIEFTSKPTLVQMLDRYQKEYKRACVLSSS